MMNKHLVSFRAFVSFSYKTVMKYVLFLQLRNQLLSVCEILVESVYLLIMTASTYWNFVMVNQQLFHSILILKVFHVGHHSHGHFDTYCVL